MSDLWTTEEVKYMIDDVMAGFLNALEEDRSHTIKTELYYSTALEKLVYNLKQAREDIKSDKEEPTDEVS